MEQVPLPHCVVLRQHRGRQRWRFRLPAPVHLAAQARASAASMTFLPVLFWNWPTTPRLRTAMTQIVRLTRSIKPDNARAPRINVFPIHSENPLNYLWIICWPRRLSTGLCRCGNAWFTFRSRVMTTTTRPWSMAHSPSFSIPMGRCLANCTLTDTLCS